MVRLEIVGKGNASRREIRSVLHDLLQDRIDEIGNLLRDIEKNLSSLRHRHGIDDEEFLGAFNGGRLSDDEDFIAWEAYLQVKAELLEELEILEEMA